MDVSDQELKLRLRLAQIEKNEACQEDFLVFVKNMWPEFIAGRHHKIIAEKLERVAKGELKRLIINMAPRHTKSEFASFLFPAWMMGRNPKMKIIQATHTTELAVNFGRKTKTFWTTTATKRFFRMLNWQRIVKRLDVGIPLAEACTMLLALAVILLAVVGIL